MLVAAVFFLALAPMHALQKQSLDGEWQIVPDAKDSGVESRWFDPGLFPLANARPILVPGNINEAWPNPAPVTEPAAANLDWYWRAFSPSFAQAENHRYYIRFGAVWYRSEIWLNGVDLGIHEGGQDPFELDVTHDVAFGKVNILIVRVASPYFGGMTQPVELVDQPAVRIIDAFAQPDIPAGMIRLEVNLENNTQQPASITLDANFGEYNPQRALGTQSITVDLPPGPARRVMNLPVPHPHLWNLDDPFLYTVAVASRWGGGAAGNDEYKLRMGFRDFRITDGYFCLNGQRLFLKSTHGNWYEPVVIQGNARSNSYLRRDLPELKRAGFNTLRMIISAAMPQILDEADELGFLIYSEHETSWQLRDPTKFGVSLNPLVRRDRNHPSLVMWGLLNETASRPIYQRARAWLPSLRDIDPSRLVMLSSGRWDEDFHTGSASNPGSYTWNVYLGGEDPVHPVPTGVLPLKIGAFHNGTGDAHVYESYPTSWKFIMAFEELGHATKPFFLSEAGDGSAYNPYDEQRRLDVVHAPADAYARGWIRAAIEGLDRSWREYGLGGIYPQIETMLIDSALAQSRQRALTFSFVRANPKVNGYNLTSLNDCWGSGEGVLDNFQEFKPGHFDVLQQGWAPLRWCLLVDRTNVYTGAPLHLRASLANDHVLPAGSYGFTLALVGDDQPVWQTHANVTVGAGADAPLAYLVFDQDVRIPDVPAGKYTLRARLDGRANAAAEAIQLYIARSDRLPRTSATVTVVGVGDDVRRLLTAQGATVREYTPGKLYDREVVLVGGELAGGEAQWRDLYRRIARGAHVVFLSPRVFSAGATGHKAPLQWLALDRRGELISEVEWLYHKDIVAKDEPAFAGLETRLMTPEYYGPLLADAPYYMEIAPPDESDAVAVRCVADGAARFAYRDGLVLGSYRHHAGRFTLNGLDLIGNIGHPAADRLIINLVALAAADAAPIAELPNGYEMELSTIGIAGPP